ncbi:hypothetical protein GDO86_015736 [Hymenochirus boettgeri]|uniref:Actin maturation protease n=1 Tax=Hymenochirus boettgeri TaxID=247094 RepID=A0A8T2K2B1_9PIPI|nr:hypothetical protein GDO86_015736 [Hymenochirus boettgeri]
MPNKHDNYATVQEENWNLVPPPPLPPPSLHIVPLPSSVVKQTFFKKVAENSAPSSGGCEEFKRMIKNSQSRFSENLQWLLYNKYVPSMIQEGPQCGLVALWMAGRLLNMTQEVTLGAIVETAVSRRYTAQGEMFSAANMASLGEEVFGCRSELLTGGMDGENRDRILHHLTTGLPLLVPYDDDFNHEPCQREGHSAHWAVISGVLFGTEGGSFNPDPDIPGLCYPNSNSFVLEDHEIQEIYLVAKQGKSLRYKLWEYGAVSRSNGQLIYFDPKRENDGRVYILPDGGVKAGLCGFSVLLHPKES